MRKAVFRYYLLATASLVLGVVHAQGPAPSPLISAPTPAPANVPAIVPQPSPASAPELTKSDFETFLDALIPSQLQNRKCRRCGSFGGERRQGIISKGLRLR